MEYIDVKDSSGSRLEIGFSSSFGIRSRNKVIRVFNLAMERNLKQNRDPTSKIRHSLHSLDVDRVRYVLTSYMRERIKKIEQRPAHILHRFTFFELISNSRKISNGTYRVNF